MEYRKLGKSGLKISELSLGSWLTFGGNLDIDGVRASMRTAYEKGVNFFDNAETYADGVSELLMGEALRDFKRENLVISTKIFWGGDGINDTGLSWKHLVAGTKNSLKRLQLDYVDLLFCHRPDPSTPIEETVRAMDTLIKQGLIFYWGTSEWSHDQIEEAYRIAYEIQATPPSMEQPEYNLFHRERVEVEYAPLYRKWGLGTTIWSPLASGVLTGKYNQGIPAGSRLANTPWLQSARTEERISKVKHLTQIADEIGCTMSQLAIAWCLKNPNVSTVILGASNLKQLTENLKASEFKSLITDDILARIERILK